MPTCRACGRVLTRYRDAHMCNPLLFTPASDPAVVCLRHELRCLEEDIGRQACVERSMNQPPLRSEEARRRLCHKARSCAHASIRQARKELRESESVDAFWRTSGVLPGAFSHACIGRRAAAATAASHRKARVRTSGSSSRPAENSEVTSPKQERQQLWTTSGKAGEGMTKPPTTVEEAGEGVKKPPTTAAVEAEGLKKLPTTVEAGEGVKKQQTTAVEAGELRTKHRGCSSLASPRTRKSSMDVNEHSMPCATGEGMASQTVAPAQPTPRPPVHDAAVRVSLRQQAERSPKRGASPAVRAAHCERAERSPKRGAGSAVRPAQERSPKREESSAAHCLQEERVREERSVESMGQCQHAQRASMREEGSPQRNPASTPEPHGRQAAVGDYQTARQVLRAIADAQAADEAAAQAVHEASVAQRACARLEAERAKAEEQAERERCKRLSFERHACRAEALHARQIGGRPRVSVGEACLNGEGGTCNGGVERWEGREALVSQRMHGFLRRAARIGLCDQDRPAAPDVPALIGVVEHKVHHLADESPSESLRALQRARRVRAAFDSKSYSAHEERSPTSVTEASSGASKADDHAVTPCDAGADQTEEDEAQSRDREYGGARSYQVFDGEQQRSWKHVRDWRGLAMKSSTSFYLSTSDDISERMSAMYGGALTAYLSLRLDGLDRTTFCRTRYRSATQIEADHFAFEALQSTAPISDRSQWSATQPTPSTSTVRHSTPGTAAPRDGLPSTFVHAGGKERRLPRAATTDFVYEQKLNGSWETPADRPYDHLEATLDHLLYLAHARALGVI